MIQPSVPVSHRGLRLTLVRATIAWLPACLATTMLCAQQPAPGTAKPRPAASEAAAAQAASTLAAAHGQLLLVLPFDNVGTDQASDWIAAAFVETLNQRFTSAGFLPISRGDRAYALEHLGLPQDFKPTHASTLRLAQTLDADYVVVGTYRVDGTRITATARVLDLAGPKMGPPLMEQAELTRLPDVLNALAWRVVRQLDAKYPVAEQTFLAADANLRLDVFENYVRGLSEDRPEERVRHLREAVQLNAQYYPAWLALGQALFAAQEYDQAALAFGHLTRDDPKALEADFYRGLAYFYTGKYLQAEDAFAFVTMRLPLPEVVNNQGVAASRRGKFSAPMFQQAIGADPKDADYHFNLAVALARRADADSALKELDQMLKLRPGDQEAQAFQANLRAPAFVAGLRQAASAASSPAGSPAPTQPATNLPLERIKRSYNEAGFRQAAYEMEQMEAVRSSALPGADRAAMLIKNGDRYLNTGLLVEAERQYSQAIAADAGTAAAYAGLAQIRERTGDREAARSEAQQSLQHHPNVPAYLVLARLDLSSSQLPAAAEQVQQALRLAPADANARGLKQALESRGQQVAQ